MQSVNNIILSLDFIILPQAVLTTFIAYILIHLKMNKIALSMIISTMIYMSCSKEKIKSGDNLPTEVKTYVTTHYPNQSITEAVIDKTDSTNSYEVKLNNATSLEFNYKKEIVDIDGNTKLPSSVISSKISDYVSVNYPNNFITGWEMDEGKQEVELNNRVDLEFNMNNDFLQIDVTE